MTCGITDVFCLHLMESYLSFKTWLHCHLQEAFPSPWFWVDVPPSAFLAPCRVIAFFAQYLSGQFAPLVYLQVKNHVFPILVPVKTQNNV